MGVRLTQLMNMLDNLGLELELRITPKISETTPTDLTVTAQVFLHEFFEKLQIPHFYSFFVQKKVKFGPQIVRVDDITRTSAIRANDVKGPVIRYVFLL